MTQSDPNVQFSLGGDAAKDFKNGDQIAVEVYDTDGSTFAAMEYSYGNSKFTSDNAVNNESSNELSYVALYPHNTPGYSFTSAFNFEISVEQNISNNYRSSNLLVAKVKATTSSKPKLKFNRAMANIEIDIEGVDIDECEAIVYAKNGVECNITDEIYTATGDIVEITPVVEGSKFKAAIAPQEFKGVVAQLTIDGETYRLNNSSTTFESGKCYSYTWDNSSKTFTNDSHSSDDSQIKVFTKYLPANHKFTHPNALFNESDFERVRQNIEAADPNNISYCAYKHFKENSVYANIDWKINPQTYFCRQEDKILGYKSNSQIGAKDAAHALQCAMMWRFLYKSDPETAVKYAEKAVLTLNGWARSCQTMAGTVSDRFLGFGFQGYQFGLAGATLRGYEGWADEDVEYYCDWLKEKWFPQNRRFLEGTWRTSCDFHYWTNWPLGNMASAMAIGICCEDVEIVNYVLKNFYEGHHNGGLKYMFPYEGFADPSNKSKTPLAQGQESGRDQGHTMIDMVTLAEFCQMAYNQNVDLFSYDNYRVLQGFEYTAKYNTRSESFPDKWVSAGDMEDAPNSDWMLGDETMPFIPYVYCPNGTYFPEGWFSHFTEIPEECGCPGCNGLYPNINVCDPAGRGGLRASWDLIYNHYTKVEKLDVSYLYYSSYAARQTRYSATGVLIGDPGSGDVARIGNNSSAFDQTGWSSLMFSRE